MKAKLVLNPNGTYKLVDLEGNDLEIPVKYENGIPFDMKIKKDLDVMCINDLKEFYGVDIINFNEFFN